jgi:alkyl sulfatase BDS1-like metallo-beta-lactamase superfamily hydrolase
MANPKKLDSVIRAAGQALTVDSGRFQLTDWLFTLKGIDAGNVTMIKTNAGNFHSQTVNGQAFETLDPTSLELLRSVRDDKVESFVAQHPDWVNADGAPVGG